VNFIAFLVAFAAEWLTAGQLALRDPAWVLGYVRAALRMLGRAGTPSLPFAIGAAILPGALAGLVLLLPPVHAHPLLRILFAALVLFFSLGPRELGQEVGAYRAALARGDAVQADRLAAEVLEHDAGQRHGPCLESVAAAVLVQANNRLFGVMFWFALLGPLGALTFRVTDLMRREAIVRAARVDAPPRAAEVGALCQRLHGVLAFVPARLLALSYGVAGSFEESFTGWRRYLTEESDHFFHANDRLLVHAGRGALGARWEGARDEGERAQAALALTRTALFVWLAVFALLTVPAWIA